MKQWEVYDHDYGYWILKHELTCKGLSNEEVR